jgi:hypothetical protein
MACVVPGAVSACPSPVRAQTCASLLLADSGSGEAFCAGPAQRDSDTD